MAGLSPAPPEPGSGARATALHRARGRAAALLRLEAAWPFLLPAIAALLAFATLAAAGVPQRLPVWLHVAVMLLLLAWIGRAAWRAAQAAPDPPQDRVDRRIERSSGLVHRPLQTLADRPADAKGETQARLWLEHRRRAEASLADLRAGAPRLPLWRHVAGRLSLAAAPLLLLALVLAGPQALPRLLSGFLPGLFEPPGPVPWMQAWVTPPGYTRAAPVFLTDPHAVATVPAGSILQVNMTGLTSAPELSVDGSDPGHPPVSPQAGDAPQAAASPQGDAGGGVRRLGEGSWSLTRTVDGSARVRLRGNGRQVADWTLRVTPLPPTLVAWDGAPGASSSRVLEPWRTRLPWRFSNPYGLRSLTAELRLAGQTNLPPGLAPLRVDIPVDPEARDGHGAALPDLSADPRAGEEVTGRLDALDASGHHRLSKEARFRLPARPFRNPVARAVLDVRRRLALGRESREDAASDLDAVGSAPGQLASDSGLFLNLVATAALLRDHDVDEAAGISQATDQLWQLALALEDGLHNDRQNARAAEALRAARDSVASQLERMRELGARGQTPREQSELERRIQALQQAINRRMQALAEQARRDHTIMPALPDMQRLTGGDLQRMMQRMRDEASQGHVGDAMRRLSQMQAMLDHMRAATPRDLQSAEQQAEAQRQAREQLDDLKDLVQRQSGLLDRSQARASARQRLMRQQSLGAIDPQTAELLRRLGIPPSETDPDAGPPGSDQAQAATPPPGQGSQGDQGSQNQQEAGQQGGSQTGQDAGGQDAGGQDAGNQGAPPGAGQPAAGADPKGDAQARARDAQRGRDAQLQRTLGRAVEELAEEFKSLSGSAPGRLASARHDMDAARRALGQGDDEQAQSAQQQALADLQQGNQQMRQAMRSGRAGASLVMMPGLGGEGGNEADNPGQDEAQGDDQSDGPPGTRDPLGRPVGGAARADESDTHIPDKAEQMRAREIEQELRRRDSDRTRPPAELDYLDRLLKPF